MNARSRKMFAAAFALAGAMLFAEPGVRSSQQASAYQWQLFWGSQYDYCEGCCGMGLCCNLSVDCRQRVD